ncbi:MAG: hypothetical protein CM15mP22_7570 [Gammaproteobacteria bacterium]|nr:MAG: hypothetical protein CM15mP22_7570 [Gammaproteobacteria bacterium]
MKETIKKLKNLKNLLEKDLFIPRNIFGSFDNKVPKNLK